MSETSLFICRDSVRKLATPTLSQSLPIGGASKDEQKQKQAADAKEQEDNAEALLPVSSLPPVHVPEPRPVTLLADFASSAADLTLAIHQFGKVEHSARRPSISSASSSSPTTVASSSPLPATLLAQLRGSSARTQSPVRIHSPLRSVSLERRESTPLPERRDSNGDQPSSRHSVSLPPPAGTLTSSVSSSPQLGPRVLPQLPGQYTNTGPSKSAVPTHSSPSGVPVPLNNAPYGNADPYTHPPLSAPHTSTHSSPVPSRVLARSQSSMVASAHPSGHQTVQGTVQGKPGTCSGCSV